MSRIGIVTVATGKYVQYLPELWDGIQQYFLPKHERVFFCVADGPVPKGDHVIRVAWRKLGWPHDTLKRYHAILTAWDWIGTMDYVYHIDADMKIVARVGSSILGRRVATLHPGFVGKRGSYETRPESAAYVAPAEGAAYYCGGFGGGTVGEFLKTALGIRSIVDADLARGIMPVWHDESCLNRYYIDNPPTLVLNPSYCYPDGWDLPYTPRIVALNKNHDEMREWSDDWWATHAPTRIEDFRGWIGSWEMESRKYARGHVARSGYGSLVDVGCGLGVDLDGYREEGYRISYWGVDSCEFFVEEVRRKGVDAIVGKAQDLPIPDKSADVVYLRHVLEHLSGYEDALRQAIRVAKKEVLVIFFLVPGEFDRIDLGTLEGVLLYHNRYSKEAMETYLKENPEVERLEWRPIGERECALHIYLEQP